MQQRSAHRGRYGLTAKGFEAMKLTQAGKCAICQREPSDSYGCLSVDHCHTTGIVRGLLCRNCNGGIGLLKDDPELLLTAVAYLRKGR